MYKIKNIAQKYKGQIYKNKLSYRLVVLGLKMIAI